MISTRHNLIDAGYEYVGDQWPEVARSSPSPPSVGWYGMMAEMIDQSPPYSEVWYNPLLQQWWLWTPAFPTLE